MSGMTPNPPITWGMKDPYGEHSKPWNPGSGATPFDEYLAASAEADVPPTVCIRHGRHIPCRAGHRFGRQPAADDCLLSSHGSMVAMVDAYQADPDAVRWDFEHVVRSWLWMQKRNES